MTTILEANEQVVLRPRRDVREIVPVSDMTMWRWIRAKKFPEPVKMAGRNYWRSDEIDAWLTERTNARGEAA